MSLVRQFALELFENVHLFVHRESEEEGDQLVRIESSEGRKAGNVDVAYIHIQYTVVYIALYLCHYMHTMCGM